MLHISEVWLPLKIGVLTIRGELILVKHGNTQHVLIKILDEELAVKIPFGVQSIWQHPCSITLRPHADLTVRIAFPFTKNREMPT